MMAGRFREALAQFRDAAARDPLVIDPAASHERVRLGIAALRSNRGAAAVEQLEAAVAALPASSEAHRVLGVVYRAVGRVRDSIGQFESAATLAPEYERARVSLGTALAETGRLDDAARVLRDTIVSLPASGSARWALSDVYERLERGPDAIAVLDEATLLTVVAGKSQLYWRIAQLAHGYRRDYAHVIDVCREQGATIVEPPTKNQGARRVWSDSKGRIWVSEWNSGNVSRYDPKAKDWKTWKLPGDSPRAYAVYVDDKDKVWLSEWSANAMVRFDPETEKFEAFPSDRRGANVRQILGRPGEVWAPESGADRLVVYRMK